MEAAGEIVCADIGGSHITAAYVNLDSKKVVQRTKVRQQINAKGSAKEILEAWSQTLTKVSSLGGRKLEKVSLAVPGPFDYERGVSYIKDNDKYESLYQVNVKVALSDLLQIDPSSIKMQNDAACYLQGEVFAGAARQSARAIGITLGTGIGSATYQNSVSLDANRWCMPFKESIAETYLSSRWFLQQFAENFGEHCLGVRELIEKHPDDTRTSKIFREFASNLSEFLIDFLDAHPSEVIVIGGNIARAWQYFLGDVQARVALRHIGVNVRLSELGEEAPMIGAAAFWKTCHRSGTSTVM